MDLSEMKSISQFDFVASDTGPSTPAQSQPPVLPPAFRSFSPVARDVAIPAHLIQAANLAASARHEDAISTWESDGGRGPSPKTNEPSSASDNVTTEKQARRRFSYSPGSPDAITLNQPLSPLSRPQSPVTRPLTPKTSGSDSTTPLKSPLNGVSRDFSFKSTSNPFERLSNELESTVDCDTARESLVSAPENVYVPQTTRPRLGTVGTIVDAIFPDVQRKLTNTSYAGLTRASSMRRVLEKAKERGSHMQREKWVQILFEYSIYTVLLLITYFGLVGAPLWKGSVWWLYWLVNNKFTFAGGFSIVLGLALFYAFAPLFVLFEDAPAEDYSVESKIQPNVQDTALLIPCYKSANLIGATLEAALKVFPPSHIFVIANGNSPTPLDNTEKVCHPYGVNYIWSSIGSKIVAQFVGCYAAKGFRNVLLIDDDCAIPPNFPVVSDRLVDNVMCIGYTIKSVGPNSSKGNLCQQAQDLEYKLSGLQRDFAGRIGSATFPHGAISLWDRKLLIQTFHEHPGFSVSEDWFFGHVARKLGSRIKMCSSIFVKTETPTAVFVSSGGSRGGFGEMTIFQQRFKRWNFFFVNGMYYNLAYIFGSWKLGFWEVGAKIFVFQEVYETLLYLLTPFILPISFIVRPSFCGILLGSTIVMYLANVIIFNEIHLRRKGERLGWQVMYIYYLPYKVVLTGINVASCYWSLYKYARYFAKRHLKVIDDEKAVEVVVRLEEEAGVKAEVGLGRRLTVRTVSTRSSCDENDLSVSEIPVADHGALYQAGQTTDTRTNKPARLMEGIDAVDFSAPRQSETCGASGHYRDEAGSSYSEYSSERSSLRSVGHMGVHHWV